ncbi:MAG: zinc-binding dehydrogenase, partial [Candidatus Thermoplasmatota archaeon]
IESVGEDVKKYKRGDRVFVSHHVPCNTCIHCLRGNYSVCDTLRTTNFDPGGFAEYVRVPKINVDRGVFILPNEIPFEEGTFIEPLACVIRGQRIAGMKTSDSLLVIGSGISGILHIKLACAIGAGNIFATDINEYRLKYALEAGADRAFNTNILSPERLRKANNGLLADVVIVATGAKSAIENAFEFVERGGTILLFAPPKPDEVFQIPLYKPWVDGVKIVSSYAASALDITQAIELLKKHRIVVKDMITHRLSLAETGLGFQLVESAKESLKVIIEPQR